MAGAMLAVLALVGCGGQQATSSASPTTSAVTSPSPSDSPSPSPSGSLVASVPDSKLTCTKVPVPPDPLLLMRGDVSGLFVLDVVDPLRPVKVCEIVNARGGRFISGTKIAFWYSTFVGTVDLQTGNLTWNRAFLNEPGAVAFSADGANWAY